MLADMLLIKSREHARMLGLDLAPVSVADSIYIGAFEIQTGIQLSDLPAMVDGFWPSWEECCVGLQHLKSDFTMDSPSVAACCSQPPPPRTSSARQTDMHQGEGGGFGGRENPTSVPVPGR